MRRGGSPEPSVPGACRRDCCGSGRLQVRAWCEACLFVAKKFSLSSGFLARRAGAQRALSQQETAGASLAGGHRPFRVFTLWDPCPWGRFPHPCARSTPHRSRAAITGVHPMNRDGPQEPSPILPAAPAPLSRLSPTHSTRASLPTSVVRENLQSVARSVSTSQWGRVLSGSNCPPGPEEGPQKGQQRSCLDHLHQTPAPRGPEWNPESLCGVVSVEWKR